MKKKFSLLLAGTMTLSILLSGCGSQADGPGTVSTQPVDETASAIGSETAQASTPPAEPIDEPSQAEGNTDMPDTASKESEESVQLSTPAVVNTPAPAVNTPAPAVSEPVADVPPASTVPEPAPEPDPESTPAPVVTKADAAAFIGQSVSSLIAAIGQPLSQSYAPSCLGGGEDGELVYNGFTVYTYREDGVETVQDVM